MHEEDYVIIRIPKSKMGRPASRPKDFDTSMAVKDIMQTYHVSRATAYRWKKKAGAL